MSRWIPVLAFCAIVPGAAAQERTLEEELAALQRELQAPQYTDDPFAEGRVPDLMIISTSDLRGEVRPCG